MLTTNRYGSEVFSAPSLDHLYTPGTSPDEAPAPVSIAVHELGAQLAGSLMLGRPKTADPFALCRLRSELLVGGKLQLSALNKKLAEVSTRASNLQLGAKYPLFGFPRVGLPGEDDDDRARSYVIPKPLDCSKAVLAEQYLHKYGVRIVPVLAPHAREDYLRCILRHLSVRMGEPVGFLLRVITDHDNSEVFNYQGHVLPLVIQETPQGLDVINFNSLGEQDHSYKSLLINLHAPVELMPEWSVRSAMVASQRQGDSQSCHTDALQILKDALVEFKQSGTSNFFEQVSNLGTRYYPRLEGAVFRLPAALHKTSQRSAALREDDVNPRTRVGLKNERLQSHREKYAAGFFWAGRFMLRPKTKP